MYLREEKRKEVLSEPRELDHKDLKILAQKETIAELQDRISDLRVELTILNQQLNQNVVHVDDGETQTEDD